MGATGPQNLAPYRYLTLALPHCCRNEPLLRARHFGRVSGILVVKPLQMEKSMRDVQTQFSLN